MAKPTKPARPARSSRARTRVEKFYRDRRGNAHDAESNVIVPETAVREATEVEPPPATLRAADEQPESPLPRGDSQSDAGTGGTPAESERGAIPDLPAPPSAAPSEVPTAPANGPVVERAGDSIPDLPAPPGKTQAESHPSPPPAALAPAIGSPSAPANGIPTAPPMPPTNGAPVVERAPAMAPPPMAPVTDAGAEAQRLGLNMGRVEDCPHCETDLRVCPRCGQEYAPVAIETAQMIGVLVGKLSGSLARGWIGRKMGFEAGPAVLSEAEVNALTKSTHDILRRRLPAKAGGAAQDIVAAGVALVGSAACQIQDALAEHRKAQAAAPVPSSPSSPTPATAPSSPAAVSPGRFGQPAPAVT